MSYSPEIATALKSVDERLEPGQRVVDGWEELPGSLRDRLKLALAGTLELEHEEAFAEFVQMHLTALRRAEEEGVEVVRG